MASAVRTPGSSRSCRGRQLGRCRSFRRRRRGPLAARLLALAPRRHDPAALRGARHRPLGRRSGRAAPGAFQTRRRSRSRSRSGARRGAEGRQLVVNATVYKNGPGEDRSSIARSRPREYSAGLRRGLLVGRPHQMGIPDSAGGHDLGEPRARALRLCLRTARGPRRDRQWTHPGPAVNSRRRRRSRNGATCCAPDRGVRRGRRRGAITKRGFDEASARRAVPGRIRTQVQVG